jgi:hypothetical protein
MPSADPGAASRAARVAERVRAIPPGFVRTFADIDPAAPGRSAGSSPAPTTCPGTELYGPTAARRWALSNSSGSAAKESRCAATGSISTEPG